MSQSMLQTSAAAPDATLSAPKTPLGAGGITGIGIALSAALVALGIVGVHDGIVGAGWLQGSSWLLAVTERLDGLRPAAWVLPLGFALVLVGLWLLLVAVRPRPRKAIALTAKTGVYLRPRDVAALSIDAAQDVDGVTSASASASTRKMVVSVRTTTSDGMHDLVSQAVARRLSAVSQPPTIRVVVTTEEGAP